MHPKNTRAPYLFLALAMFTSAGCSEIDSSKRNASPTQGDASAQINENSESGSGSMCSPAESSTGGPEDSIELADVMNGSIIDGSVDPVSPSDTDAIDDIEIDVGSTLQLAGGGSGRRVGSDCQILRTPKAKAGDRLASIYFVGGALNRCVQWDVTLTNSRGASLIRGLKLEKRQDDEVSQVNATTLHAKLKTHGKRDGLRLIAAKGDDIHITGTVAKCDGTGDAVDVDSVVKLRTHRNKVAFKSKKNKEKSTGKVFIYSRVSKAKAEKVNDPTYALDIKPIFDSHCISCHNPDSGRFPDLSVAPSAATVDLLLPLVSGPTPQMPRGQGPKLTEEEIAKIQAWRSSGLQP